MTTAQPPDVLASDLGLAPAPAGPRRAVPGARRLRRRRHRRGHARHRHGPRQAHPAVHRRRHQLRDRAQRRRHASCPPPRPPARRSRAARSGAACGPPTARSRWSSSTPTRTTVDAAGDRRRRAARACAAPGLVDAVAELVSVGLLDASGASSPTRSGRGLAPGLADRLDDDRRGAGLRAAPARRRDADPAECVYLSQRDVRELQFAKAAISTGWTLLLERARPRAPRRPAGAARRLVRHLPVPRLRGPDRAGPQAAGAADRLRRQRRRRGREDGAAVGARARGRRRPAGGGDAMSSSPTAPTSTTRSSTSSRSDVLTAPVGPR